ncbi:histidine--tRNA ligase [Helicobacter sp. MIT 21-1697]|uniref:histidine--tRNA ligase n=1 Tax=Helicobacter sp. MIT 21-1697 TaxID=2993733 RepID=UPI00224A81B2|nr:histidine--tRNA ligase [Helicobacter sp. MIT 21-1697]MCX2716602.1 histidine--tRNA ligase [Helicobacter sp. MIT 21-1697]
MVTPRALSGFKDRLPKEALAKAHLLNKVSNVFMNFGFVPIETPHLEYADVLIKQGSDEIQKELYRFKDHGGRDVALRFDLTVPLARFVSQYKNDIGLPFKRYAIGNVFRGERAQRGRYREFTQCDFDFIGSDSISCDAEILQVIYASLMALGIEEFTIWLNHRGILNGICEYCGITQENDVNIALRIIDKLDKIGKDNVSVELQKELHLNSTQVENLLEYTSIKQQGDSEIFFKQISFMEEWNDSIQKGIKDLKALYKVLSSLQMDRDTYRINFSIARGLGYYTGIVYETTLNALKSIGSVCSGGRYDNLTRTFSKEKMSGVGASIGIDRLLAALEELDLLQKRATSARVLIVCMDSAYFGYAHLLAESFRCSEIPIEVYPEISKLKKQFTYAHLKGYEFVIVIGESEFGTKTLTLKNMTSGMQIDGISFLKALTLIQEEKI